MILPELDKIYRCFLELCASFLLHGRYKCNTLPFSWEEMSWHAPDHCTPKNCIDVADSDYSFHSQKHMCHTKASHVLANSFLSDPNYCNIINVEDRRNVLCCGMFKAFTSLLQGEFIYPWDKIMNAYCYLFHVGANCFRSSFLVGM